MEKRIFSLISLISLLTVFHVSAMEKSNNFFRFTTWNIRRDKPEKNEQNNWKNRISKVVAGIKQMNPDIIGFQEPIESQVKDLQKELPEYTQFGDPRSIGVQGWSWHWFVMKFATNEYNPIFYKKDRVNVLENGTFAINPQYNLPQHLKDLPRICTWGKFKDLKTDKEFFVYNMHLDHGKQHVRNAQITLVLKDIKKRAEDYPVILMGDFNTDIVDEIQQKLTDAGFQNTKTIAQQTKGPQETSTGWNNDDLKPIDHIVIRTVDNTEVLLHEVVKSPEGEFPSDHRPVYVEVKL